MTIKENNQAAISVQVRFRCKTWSGSLSSF